MPERSRACLRCGTSFTPTATQLRDGNGKYCSRRCYHTATRRSPRVEVTCICGKLFEVSVNRLAAGRGKFCSKSCRYENATRRSGLTYEIKVENQAWFKPGEARPRGEESPSWRGEDIGYQGLHRWVARNRIKPEACEHCEQVAPLDWANKSRAYHRDLDDWIALCRRCHRRYDSGPWRGMATMKYGAAALQGRKSA